jgi:Carboxypeptidase regulatory-like domain
MDVKAKAEDSLRQERSIFQNVSKHILILGVTIFLVFFASSARAQSGAGSIQGTVTDSTGAIMPGAAVHVINLATGVAADTKTNKVGFYQVPDLFTGTYTVSVSAASMKTSVRTIELLASQNAVINAALTPGSVTEKVEVSGNLVQLTDNEDGTISSTLDAARMQQIPENTRSLMTLAYDSTPGFDVPNSNQPGQTPGASTAGERAGGLFGEALNYVADGVTLTNRNFGGETNASLATLPDPDSIQQVTLKLSDASAQYATPGTAIITTKSGTNSIHGTAFETAINSYWGLAKTRNDLSDYTVPPYVRNEFGVSVGGPIVLPHIYHGKDKSFWFFSYERYSIAATLDEQVSVPTAAMRNGDFSGLTDSSGDPITLYDPATTAASTACASPVLGPNGGFNPPSANSACRTPFPTINGLSNQIPANRESPAAKVLYDVSPLPTNPNNPFITGKGNFTAPNVTYVVVPSISFRLDQNFSEKNKAYLHYTSNNQINRALRNYPSDSAATLAADGFPAGASGYQAIPISNFGASLGYTHIFSSSFFSETILSNQWQMQYVGGGGNPNLNYEQMLGLPNNFGETGFPYIASTIMPYGGTMFNYQSNQNISQIDENLTKTVGNHQMYFGGRYHHERLYYLNSRDADEENFGPYTTGLYDTSAGNTGGTYPAAGNANGDFYLGGPATYYVWLQPPPSWFRDQEIDAYFQDNWHIARSLTLDLGLRYEAHPARQTKDGANDGLDIANHAIVLGNSIQNLINLGYTTQPLVSRMEAIGVNFETPSEAGFPDALYTNANLDFSPRVGFAWQPFENRWGTILRGAFGRYIYPEPTRSQNPGPTALPFTYEYGQNYENASQAPGGESGYLLRNPQTIVMGVNSANVVSTASSATTGILPGFSATFYDPDFKSDMATEVNTTVEQPLKWNSALRVSWVWTHGSYLDHEFDLNGHPSTPVWESQYNEDPPTGSTIGTSTYTTTSTGPWDNKLFAAIPYLQKNGWSSDNQMQINYQRLYNHGFGWQIFWVYSKAFRVGGNQDRDGVTYPWENYLGTMANPNVTLGVPTGSGGEIGPLAIPPTPPTNVATWWDWHKLDVWEEYKRDSAVSPQHIAFNYVVDMPFGRGKRFFGSPNRLVNELIGGYQIAGVGHMVSQIFQPTATNYGPISSIHVYKHKMPITDCTSGACYREYMWFNGYIPPTQNANSGYCTKNCISGLPPNYVAYQTPIDDVPGTTYYNENEVTVTGSGLNAGKGGSENQTLTDGLAGANPFSKTFIQGPKNWESDISLYKIFPVTERLKMNFKMDVFNFLNHQGYNNPNATSGIQEFEAGGVSGATSYNAGRQVQFTLRLLF